MTPRYLTSRPGKAGSKRYFWQPPATLAAHGFKTQRLSNDEAAAAVQAEFLNAGLDAWRATGAEPATPLGTVASLITSYKASFHWREHSAGTRKSYDYAFRIIRAKFGAANVRIITPMELETFYRTLRRTPAKMMQVARVMRVLMEYAIKRNLITVNPATKPGVSYTAPKGELWTHEDVTAFVAAADALGIFDMGTAVALNEWIGQRPSDISSMRLDAYRNGKMYKRQKKTAAEVELPVDMVPHLQARLAEQVRRNLEANPASIFLLPGVHGAGMSESVFRSTFNLVRRAAGLSEKLTFRTLRHTAVTRMGEAGVIPQQIAAVTGWKLKTCLQILETYNITTSKMAAEAFRTRLAAEARVA